MSRLVFFLFFIIFCSLSLSLSPPPALPPFHREGVASVVGSRLTTEEKRRWRRLAISTNEWRHGTPCITFRHMFNWNALDISKVNQKFVHPQMRKIRIPVPLRWIQYFFFFNSCKVYRRNGTGKWRNFTSFQSYSNELVSIRSFITDLSVWKRLMIPVRLDFEISKT